MSTTLTHRADGDLARDRALLALIGVVVVTSIAIAGRLGRRGDASTRSMSSWFIAGPTPGAG